MATTTNAAKSVRERVVAAQASRQANELAKKSGSIALVAEALAQRHADGLLAWCSEDQRVMPNVLLRSPLFSAKNRSDPRLIYLPKAPLVIPVIGGRELRYAGEELRQDDGTVWMQLVHMARASCSEWISFTPKSLIQKLKWALKEDSYERLLITLRRLKANSLEFYSASIDRGVSTSLIVDFEYSERGLRRGKGPWKVHVFNKENKLFFLFDSYYSRLDWETRLSLPVGAATWLHGFFATHRQPHPHKVETLIIGAGLLLERPEDLKLPESMRQSARKKRVKASHITIASGLAALKSTGFLVDFHISKKGIVTVRRAGDSRPIYA